MDPSLLLVVVVSLGALLLLGAGVLIVLRLDALTRAVERMQRVMLHELPDTVGDEIARGIEPLGQEAARVGARTDATLKALGAAYLQSQQQIQAASGELGQSIASVRQIAGGVSETARGLQQTHSELQRVLGALAAPGSVQDWVAALNQAVLPLQQVGNDIDQHYQTNDQILRLTGDMLRQWGAQGEAVAAAAAQISQTLDRWMSRQEISRSEQEQEVRQLRQQVSQDLAALAAKLSELAERVHQLATSSDHLRGALSSTADRVIQVSESQGATQQQQLQLVEEIGRMATTLSREQSELSRGLGEIVRQAREASQEMLRSQSAARAANQELFAANQQAIGAFRDEYEQLLQQVGGQVEEQAASQQALVQRLSGATKQIPLRQFQVAQLAVTGAGLLLIVILLLVLIARVGGG